MYTFEEAKAFVLKIGKEKEACNDEFTRANESNSFAELLKVIKDNSNWCYLNGILSDEFLSNIEDAILVENDIYYKKQNVEQRSGFYLYHSSTSKHYHSSTSKHYHSSTSEHYDSSTSKHYHSSTSKHYHSSTSEHHDSSTSKHYDSSTSKHYHSSTSEHYHSSTSKHYDSSTSEHHDSSYDSTYTFNPISLHDKAIIRERSTGKVYFKKGAFEIVEVN